MASRYNLDFRPAGGSPTNTFRHFDHIVLMVGTILSLIVLSFYVLLIPLIYFSNRRNRSQNKHESEYQLLTNSRERDSYSSFQTSEDHPTKERIGQEFEFHDSSQTLLEDEENNQDSFAQETALQKTRRYSLTGIIIIVAGLIVIGHLGVALAVFSFLALRIIFTMQGLFSVSLLWAFPLSFFTSLFAVVISYFSWNIFSEVMFSYRNYYLQLIPRPHKFTIGSFFCDPLRKLKRSTRLKISLCVCFILLWIVLLSAIIALSAPCLPNEPSSVDLSTRFTRWWEKGKEDFHCKDNSICHVYLILPPKPTSQMQVVFHSTFRPTEVTVYYWDEHSKANGSSIAVSKHMSYLEVTRYVNTALLTNLNANSTYHFYCVAKSHSTSAKSSTKKFRTLPKGPGVSFVVGGDLGARTPVAQIANQIALDRPYFVAIGGDVGYGNGFSSCYCRWDRILHIFETNMVTPDGLSIPLLVVMGNHDAGGFGMGVDYVPFLLPYFPYASAYANEPRDAAGDTIWGSMDSTYHAHAISDNFYFLALDSGNAIPHSPPQSDWLQDRLENMTSSDFVCAVYHVPIFPSIRKLTEYPIPNGREWWLPLFDKYQLSVGFEHHDHIYKRTPPIRDNVLQNNSCNGTLYVGDGAWGISPNHASTKPSYVEKIGPSENYYLFVTATASSLNITAKDSSGKVFDTSQVPSRSSCPAKPGSLQLTPTSS